MKKSKCPKCGNSKYTESFLGNKFCEKPWCGELFPIERIYMNKSVYKKILDLKASVSYLQKENKNQQQGFNYVSSSQVLGAVRSKMNELGLILVAEVVKATLHEPLAGKKQYMTELDMQFTWVDVESGETLPVRWYAQGADMAEKGPGKAQTYAEKMFILKQLNIPTDKDDPDGYEERTQQRSGSESVGRETARETEGELPKTLAEGLKIIGNKTITVGGEKKKLGDTYKKFVSEMSNFKKSLGDKVYYQILGDVGSVQKSLHVLDYGTMMELFKAMREAQASI